LSAAASQGLPRLQPYAPPPDTGLEIIYQDDALIAINKPAGLLSVPGRTPDLADCALARVQQRYPQALLVHRLDEATSGLLLFALSKAAQKALGWAFESRQVRKQYLAWVHGSVAQTEGVIDAPLRVDWERRPMSLIDKTHGRPGKTLYSLLSKNEQIDLSTSSINLTCSQLLLEPQTGRSHQLRVHLQHMGHPIVGDRLYGPPDDAPRLLLHACRLELMHPINPTSRLEIACPSTF
jgi:tRNA pseudouridine32 synthase / 23S rRNA pseudouridine746 synthase